MNFKQLNYVLEIANCGSISKAAQALYVTQPTLSIAIRDLESEVGFTIFERNNRGITPTPAGLAFISTVREAFRGFETIRAQYLPDSGENAPAILRISTSRYSFVTHAVIQFYQTEFQDLSRYAITVEEQDCQQVIQDVLQKKSEIGIIHTSVNQRDAQLQHFEEKGIRCRQLFASVPYIIFRKGHPLESHEQISMGDLMKYPQVRTSSRFINHYNGNASFSFSEYADNEKNLFISSRAFIYSLLPASDAVYLCLTKQNVSDLYPALTARPLEDGVLTYFYVITLESGSPSQNAKKFIRILRQETCQLESEAAPSAAPARL